MSKNKIPKANVPRSLEDIQKDYAEVIAQAGNAQYLVYVYTQQLAKHNERLLAINEEAAARQDLDRKSAAEASQNQEPVSGAV